MDHREMRIPADSQTLPAELIVPNGATGLVVFPHGSGSNRLSPRNRSVAEIIRAAGDLNGRMKLRFRRFPCALSRGVTSRSTDRYRAEILRARPQRSALDAQTLRCPLAR